jgi:hypothetical protein
MRTPKFPTAGDQFALALERLGWSNRCLASTIGGDERMIRRWIAGDQAMPHDLLNWLQELAAYVGAHPPPAWRQRKRKDRSE